MEKTRVAAQKPGGALLPVRPLQVVRPKKLFAIFAGSAGHRPCIQFPAFLLPPLQGPEVSPQFQSNFNEGG
jgi:hypothetical protein